MNSRERVFAALHLEEPDRVPLYELAVNAYVAEKIVGKRYPPIAANPPWPEALKLDHETLVKEAVEGHVACYRALRLDMLSVFPGAPLDFKPEIKEENVLMDEWGAMYRYSPESDQAFVIDYPIKTPEDLERFVVPDPDAEGRLDIPELAVKMAGGDLAVSCWLNGLAEFVVANLMGFYGFAKFLHKYPNLLEKVLDAVTDYDLRLGKALIDVGIDVIWFGNDTADRNGPFLPPELHRKYFVPRLKKMTDAFHSKGVLVIHHSCGNNWALLDDFISSGMDALHPFEPQAGMDIVRAKKEYGDRVCIMGNIDVSHTLPFGTREDVAKEVKERIDALAPGGGYVLTSSNSIFKAIPPENTIAMFRAGLKYGSYPK